jgi:hypothetical protein
METDGIAQGKQGRYEAAFKVLNMGLQALSPVFLR